MMFNKINKYDCAAIHICDLIAPYSNARELRSNNKP